MANEVTF